MHENFDMEMLLELAAQKKFRQLKEILSEMNEVDVAEFLGEVEPDQLAVIFRLLPRNMGADVFTYLEDSEDQEKLIGALSDKELREALDELEKDQLILDVLGEHVAENYIEGKRKEWNEYRTHVTSWETEKYITVY